MKLKLDENLATSAAESLRTLEYDVDTVADEGLAGAEDPAVLAAALGDARLLLTLDRGLGDIRAYPPGTHAGVVVIGVENQSPSSVRQAIVDLCAVVDLEDLSGCVAVWRAGMLRVRRAQPTEGDRAGDD